MREDVPLAVELVTRAGAATSSALAITNLLERSLAEVNRRTKVIGRFPGETSCLTLVWAVLDLYITHATNEISSPSSNASAWTA